MKKTIEQFGVQPHSQGPLYPAIIGKREYLKPDGALDFASWTLTLDGRTEEYASYDDAATVASMLLRMPDAREGWRKRFSAAPVKSEQSPSYGKGFKAYS